MLQEAKFSPLATKASGVATGVVTSTGVVVSVMRVAASAGIVASVVRVAVSVGVRTTPAVTRPRRKRTEMVREVMVLGVVVVVVDLRKPMSFMMIDASEGRDDRVR